MGERERSKQAQRTIPGRISDMARPPLPVDWQAIRTATEAGVPMQDTADKLAIDPAAIRQRARREKWATPTKVLTKAEQIRQTQAKLREQGPEQDGRQAEQATEDGAVAIASKADGLSRNVTGGQKSTDSIELVASSLVERAEAVGLRAVAIVEQSLRPVSALPVASMSDLKAALGIARTAAGLDKAEAPGVSINMALFGAGATERATIDATGWTDDTQEADLERLEDD